MVLKYSFKLFFLKCILEFIIITAPQGSNSVNGREKYFKSVNFNNFKPRSCRMAQPYEASLSALEEVEVQVQIRARLPSFFVFLPMFFSFIVIFSLWLVSGYSHCCPFKLRESFAIMYF